MKKINPAIHIQVLKNEFESRSTRNQSYSLRAFARDLNLSPATLSLILNQKKGLSEIKANIICERLGLNPGEKEVFLRSVVSNHSRSPKLKKEATQKLRQTIERAHVDENSFAGLKTWYSLALLELMELPECKHTVAWFAERLQLNAVVVKAALERLIVFGFAEFKNGKYVATSVESTTDFDVPSQTLRMFHADILKKAEGALFEDDLASREFINMTLAFPIEEMKDAKAAIRDFQNAFALRFYNKSQKKKNAVYQLSIQLFRLDRPKEKQ